MAEISQNLFHVGRESTATLVARETPTLLAERWRRTREPEHAHDPVWIPPWDPDARLTIADALSARSHRFMSAWLAAGRPEGPDADAFFDAWVTAGCP